MRRFGGRVEENLTQKFPTVPSTNVPIRHTEDWAFLDVAVGKGKHRLDRRAKNQEVVKRLCVVTYYLISQLVQYQEVRKKSPCGKGQHTGYILFFLYGSGARKEVIVTDM
jgi:hypothetical protein